MQFKDTAMITLATGDAAAKHAVALAQHWLDAKECELISALKAIPVWRAQFADVAAQVAKEVGR